jgi:N-formylmaleamate deformylase
VDSIRLSAAGCDAEAMRAFCPTWTEEQRALRAEWLHTCHEAAIVTAFHDFQNDDIHSDFAAVRCPALLIAAGRGDVILPSEEQEILALGRTLKCVRVADAGHMIPWDDEEGFYQAFGDFLGRPV